MNSHVFPQCLRIGLFMAALCVSGCHATTERAADHKRDEWASGSARPLKLDNGLIHVEVDAQIGRITAFGIDGGKNLLWKNPCDENLLEAHRHNTWLNWGGNRIWPAQQADWYYIMGRTWPPDRAFDGRPWTVIQANSHEIAIKSGVSQYLHASIIRRLTLDSRRPVLVIDETLTQHRSTPFPVQLWSIAQASLPDYCLLDIASDRADDRPFIQLNQGKPIQIPEMISLHTNFLLYHTSQVPPSTKIGALGRFIAAIYPDIIFAQYAAMCSSGAYPDGSSLQVYADKQYLELEALSPSRRLKPGQSIHRRLIWMLLKRPQAATPSLIDHYIRTNSPDIVN